MDLFGLECKAYELLERRLGDLQRYQGTDEKMDGDGERIATVQDDLVKKRADMIEYHGAKAEQYFESKQV